MGLGCKFLLQWRKQTEHQKMGVWGYYETALGFDLDESVQPLKGSFPGLMISCLCAAKDPERKIYTFTFSDDQVTQPN